MKSPITTHILDTARGCPAEGVAITLARHNGDGFETLAEGVTNSDGRVTDLLTPGALKPGRYLITFHVEAYLGEGAFFPEVPIHFRVKDTAQHYHVPLLLSPFGFSTYRGS